jgi:RNA polymerase sigma factor (sigma-70 family)
MSASSIISLLPWKRPGARQPPQPGDPPTDLALLAQFVGGDESAFAKLMERHQSLVMSVCQRILREASDAEDAFQATFLVLARKARSLNWQDSIAGWLHQTARRTALKLRSMKARRQKIEQQAARERSEMTHTEKSTEAAITVHELAEILDEELDRLPALFREVILLTQVEGLSRDETAQRLGISEAAVKDRLERGRGQLRSRLVRRGLTVSGTMLAAWLLPGTAQAASTTLVTTTVSVASVFASGVTTSGAAPAAITLAQGVLKMMGLEKLKFVAACVLSVITAGGVAYGMLHDNPQRFQKGLVGQIIDVQSSGQSASITIQLEEFDTLLNLDVSQDVKVWKAYESSGLSSVKPGQFASLRLASDHRTVNEIHVSGAQHEVAIRGLSDSGAMMAASTDDDDEETTETRPYQLAPDAILRIGGLPATREDFSSGMEVPLELADDGKTIHAIEAEADPQTIIMGSVVAIDAAAGTVIIETEDDNDTLIKVPLTIDSKALIEVDGKRSGLGSVLPGSEVILRTTADRSTVRAMRATSPEKDDDE